MEHRPPKTEEFIILLIMIFIGLLVPYFPGAFAKENNSPERDYFPISRDDLEKKLQNGEVVLNADISGDDLIAIMKKNSGLEMYIGDSIIRNGLNFNGLNKQTLKEIKLPVIWSEEDKKEWRKQKQEQKIKHIYIVEHNITINNTIIEDKKWTKGTPSHSIYAERTLFQEVDFKKVIFKGSVHFSHALFKEKAFFSRSTFVDAGFRYASFNGRTGFDKVIVKRESNFIGVTFHEKVSFSGSTFGGDLFFISANFRDEISFVGTNFGGKTDFSSAKIKGDARFLRVTFHNEATFNEAEFHEAVKFNNTIFNQDTDFSGVVFGGSKGSQDCPTSPTERGEIPKKDTATVFKNIQFKLGAFFVNATFKESLKFQLVIFEGESYFNANYFCKKVSFLSTSFKETFFNRAIFLDRSTFNDVIFSKEATFKMTSFEGKSFFKQTQFLGTANFGEAKFAEAEFVDTTFHELAYFRDAIFSKGLDIISTDFEEYIDFKGTYIENLNFGSKDKVMVIPGNLDLRDASLTQTKFQDLIFLADVDFLGTSFLKDISFDSVNFKGTANFTNANFDDAALSFSKTNYSNLLITMKQIPYPESWKGDEKDALLPTDSEDHSLLKEPLSEVFKKLEDQFRLHNQIEDANEAYFQGMVARRKVAQEDASKYFSQEYVTQYFSAEEENLEDLWPFLRLLFQERCCGYGVKFIPFAIVSFLVYFIFALAYYKMGYFVDMTKKDIAEDSIFKLKPHILPEQYLSQEEKNLSKEEASNQGRSDRFKAAFMLSLLLMCKMGLRKTKISKRPWIRSLVWIEWTIGYLWVIAFLITAKNTVPGINTLLAIF